MYYNIPVCNVCAGENKQDCICEGDGTIRGENNGLRKELNRSTIIRELMDIIENFLI